MDRYEKNFKSISKGEQLILNNSSIAIVGLGGLGGYVLENLVRLGVKNFILIDMDIFELSNLNRQILSNESNIGKYKAYEAEKRANLINSEVKTKVFTKKLHENSFDLLEGVDLVIDGLDSISGKKSLEKLCDKMDLPLIYGAISGYLGNVAYSSKGNRVVQKIYGNTKDYKNTLGNLSITCMITASLQVNLALKVLFNKDISNDLIMIDVERMIIEKLELY